MNVLYINHYAGSLEMGMEFRPYYLSREWVKNGHNVRILAGDYSHLRKKNPFVNADFEEQKIDGVLYTWIKSGKYAGNGVKRALSMLLFTGKIWKNARTIAKDWKPDVVIASSTYPLDTYAAQRIRKYSNALVIHEVHDMWPITLIELGGMSKYNPFVIMMQIAENSFCKNSDFVVSLLCAAKEYFIKHGMKEDKFRNVMNGIVLDEWKNPTSIPAEHQKLLDELHAEGHFVICFFGSITKSYAIDFLIEAARKLQDRLIDVVIVGEGNQKEELEKQAVNLRNVHFLSKIEKQAIPDLLNKVDCCYVGALHNDMFRFGICMNKLFDAMMSGKPLLYAVEAPNNFVSDYQCGISVYPEDSDALAEGIMELISMTPEQREQMGENGRNAVLDHYTYEKLAKQFESIFDRS